MKHRLKSIVFVAVFVAVGWFAFHAFRHDSTPTLYHREDGTFSLNLKSGPPVTPEEVADYFFRYGEFGHVRLVANPRTTLSDWKEMLIATSSAGAGHYQLESGEESFDFHLPLSDGGGPFDSANPEVIVIGEVKEPALDEGFPADVVILIEGDVLCADIIRAAAPALARRASVCVVGESWLLGHYRHSRPDFSGFRKKHGRFRTTYIQPWIDRMAHWW